MRHRCDSFVMHALTCTLFGVVANTTAAQSANLPVAEWRELSGPQAFTPRAYPPTYLQSGRPAIWNLAQEFNPGTANTAGEWTMGYSLNRFGAFTISPDWGTTLPGAFGWFAASVGLMSKEDAAKLKKELEDAGAKVAVK